MKRVVNALKQSLLHCVAQPGEAESLSATLLIDCTLERLR